MNVIFVAPYLLPTTIRFVSAIANLPTISVALISCDSIARLGPSIKTRLKAYERVADCLDAGQLAVAVRKLANQLGPIHRLFGSLEDLQVTLAKVRDYLDIEGMSAAVANNFRDKSRMKDVLRSANLPCARHCLATEITQAIEFVEEVGYPLIVKPPAGAGARDTFKINDHSQLCDYLAAYAPDQGEPALFEEFIQGEEFSFEAMSIAGEVIWHSLTRYYPSPLEVLKNPWIQWCVLLPREIDHPRFDNIRAVNQNALNALGMHTGLTHMEWFRRQDGSVAVSEVGARPPGAQIMSLMSYAHDKDFYNAWAELMVLERFIEPQREYAAGAAYLRGQGQGRVKKIHGLYSAQQEVGDVVMEVSLPQPGQFSATGYEGVGYVIVRHRDTEVVKQALHKLVSLIRIEYD